MTTAELIEQIRSRALALSKSEREQFVRELFTVSEELVELDADADAEIDPQLDAIMTRRLTSIRDGSAKLLSRDEFFARVRSKIAAR